MPILVNARASLLSTLRRYKHLELVYSLLLAGGFTPLGQRLRERAEQLGYGLKFRRNRIVLRMGERDLWFGVADPAQLWSIMPSLEQMNDRFVFACRLFCARSAGGRVARVRLRRLLRRNHDRLGQDGRSSGESVFI